MRDPSELSRPGRPRLPDRDRRSARVVTMVTEAEHAALRRLAKGAGLTVSALCHAFLAQAIQSATSGKPDPHRSNTTLET